MPEVVERILVSIPKPGGDEEVRIQLKSRVLDGSEIRIFRDAGEINVVFRPATEAAQQFLQSREARFQSILADRLVEDRVRVEIETAGRGRHFSGHSDGRSRNRYVPEPVYQDDETMSR